MCGIAGAFNAAQFDDNTKTRLLHIMHNRGPDAQGEYCDDKLQLFHTRLKIIDLSSRSNQPFVDDRFVFAYNGELYNYLELDKDSSSDGATFFSVLHNGLDELRDCDGMWAFALYDKQKRALTLGRDRFGEKPLFIYEDGKGAVYFASQMSYLFCMLGRSLPVNVAMVTKYLFNGYRALYKDRSQTFFKGVRQAQPGSCTTYSERYSRLHSEEYLYWTPYITDKYQPKDAEQWVADIMEEVVEQRLRTDVPIAFCMSGGVDSNALISIAKRRFDYDVHGYTIGNSDPRYDESATVDTVVKALGIRHTYVPVTVQSFLPNLRTIVANNCAPLVTISYYLHWLLLRQISHDGYKVVVSGAGGDEMFAGYYDHFLYHIADCYPDTQYQIHDWHQRIQPHVRNQHFQDVLLFVNDPSFRDYLYRPEAIIDHSMLRVDIFHEQQYFTDSVLKNRMANELIHESVPPILHDDDLNSMFFSVENRSPMLDPMLYSLMFSMDSRRFIQQGKGKFLLREALKRFAPDVEQLLPIKKTGFNCSLSTLMPGWREYLFKYDGPLWDYVDRDSLEQFDLEGEEGGKFAFSLLNAKLFLDMFG